MARALRAMAWAMGLACLPIGVVHLLWGNRSVPGLAEAGPTVDSRERFYGGLFAGYGALWLWTATRTPVPARPVRWLSGVFLLGGLGRLLSLADAGRPHPFQELLTVVELVVPPVLLVLADADAERPALTAWGRRGQGSVSRSARTRRHARSVASRWWSGSSTSVKKCPAPG